jgi:hypothetical protein
MSQGVYCFQVLLFVLLIHTTSVFSALPPFDKIGTTWYYNSTERMFNPYNRTIVNVVKRDGYLNITAMDSRVSNTEHQFYILSDGVYSVESGWNNIGFCKFIFFYN